MATATTSAAETGYETGTSFGYSDDDFPGAPRKSPSGPPPDHPTDKTTAEQTQAPPEKGKDSEKSPREPTGEPSEESQGEPPRKKVKNGLNQTKAAASQQPGPAQEAPTAPQDPPQQQPPGSNTQPAPRTQAPTDKTQPAPSAKDPKPTQSENTTSQGKSGGEPSKAQKKKKNKGAKQAQVATAVFQAQPAQTKTASSAATDQTTQTRALQSKVQQAQTRKVKAQEAKAQQAQVQRVPPAAAPLSVTPALPANVPAASGQQLPQQASGPQAQNTEQPPPEDENPDECISSLASGSINSDDDDSDPPPSGDENVPDKNQPKRIDLGYHAGWSDMLGRLKRRQKPAEFNIKAVTTPDSGSNQTIIQEKLEAEYADRKRKWGTRLAKFFESPSGIDDGEAVCPIAEKPSSCLIALYRNSKEVIIKETIPPHSSGYKGDPETKKTYRKGLLEARIQHRLSQLPMDNENIVKLYDYRIYRKERKHRLYMEHAEAGSLKQLWDRYRRHLRHFPEPFLWCLLNHMAKALLILEHGAIPPDADDHIDEADRATLHGQIEIPEAEILVADPAEGHEPEAEASAAERLREEWRSAGVLEVFRACKRQGFAPTYRTRKADIETNIENLLGASIRPDDDDSNRAGTTQPRKRRAIAEGTKDGADTAQTASKPASVESTRLRAWENRPRWREIVHRDICLDNIFLSEPPKGGFFAGYPLFKLGDFGHAFATDMVDYKNTNDFAQANRPERQAPESATAAQYWTEMIEIQKSYQAHQRAPFKKKFRKVDKIMKKLPKVFNAPLPRQTAKTNIYQLGVLMWEMMTLESALGDQDFERDRSLPYGANLWRIAEWCRAKNLRQRPSPLWVYRASLYGLACCRRKAHSLAEGSRGTAPPEQRFKVYWRRGEMEEMGTGFYVPKSVDVPPLVEPQTRYAEAVLHFDEELRPPLRRADFIATRSTHLEFFDEPARSYRKKRLANVGMTDEDRIVPEDWSNEWGEESPAPSETSSEHLYTEGDNTPDEESPSSDSGEDSDGEQNEGEDSEIVTDEAEDVDESEKRRRRWRRMREEGTREARREERERKRERRKKRKRKDDL